MAERETFPVEAGILRVTRELDEIPAEELEEALQRLVRSGAAAPVVDLADASFLPSYHIDSIRTAAEEAQRDDRSLTVRARRSIVMMLERSGVGTIARLKALE